MTKQTHKDVLQNVILPCFRKHLKEQSHVTFFNTFNGVPISHEAEVAMVNPAYVGFIVHPYQAVCIKHERRTYIKSNALSTLVRAYPVSIDYTNHVVLLRRFRIPKSIANDLNNSWISPERPVSVDIRSNGGHTFSVNLLAIAVLADNCVRVVVAVPEDAPYQRRDEVILNFHLDKGKTPVEIQGSVLSLVKIRNQDRKRLDVAGRVAMQDEISILAYIARREDQIMRMLDKVYQNLRKVKKSTKR